MDISADYVDFEYHVRETLSEVTTILAETIRNRSAWGSMEN